MLVLLEIESTQRWLLIQIEIYLHPKLHIVLIAIIKTIATKILVLETKKEKSVFLFIYINEEKYKWPYKIKKVKFDFLKRLKIRVKNRFWNGISFAVCTPWRKGRKLKIKHFILFQHLVPFSVILILWSLS